MTFATITHSPGDTVQHARAVFAVLGAEPPEGLLARIVGEVDGGLQIVAIWETQAQHDRFIAEHLHPAFREVGHRPRDGMAHVEFEVADLYLATHSPGLP